MEKLILLKPRERSKEEELLEKEFAKIAERITKMRRQGADVGGFLFHLGFLLQILGDEDSHVENYIGMGEHHG